MKIFCNSKDLQRGVAIVEKAVSQRSSLPTLENIYLSVKGNTLTLRGNDLEIGIEASLQVDSTGNDGSILVKAKTFSSILARLQNQQLDITVDENQKMIIKAGKVDFDILCTSAEEYPVFPSVEQGTTISLSVETLKRLIKYTIFSVSFDETKRFLNGILMSKDKDSLYFVATDGYRLSMKRHEVDQVENDFSVIVPYKGMNEWNKIIQNQDNDKMVDIVVSEKQVVFKLDDVLMLSRVIDGHFPDYKHVLPKQTENGFMVSRRSLLEASERASIIANESNNVVRFSFDDSKLNINANAPTMGEFFEEVELSRTRGAGAVKIAFNVRLVLDAVKVIECDDVKIEFNSGLSPCLLQPVLDDDYTYIIMPIRTSDFKKEKEADKVAVNAT
jgi:DNA polymerase III subunit beta